MLKSYISIFFMLYGALMFAQSPLNTELLAHIVFDEDGTDCWGFVDANGIEYAVMGTRTATRIYSLEDPRNPIERYVVRGAASVWRDIKYYEGFLYVTTDQGADGLTIIDCTMAPNNFSFTRWKPLVTAGTTADTLRRAHNLYIDVPTGHVFIAGHNIGNRGVIIADLKQDPNNPVITSVVNRYYSHDAYVSGNRLYSSELGEGMAIYDVTDKSAPVEITREETSYDFCHNTWSTADDRFAFTTDERSNAYLDAYDVTADGSALFLDRFRSLETFDWPVIPHNTHVLGNYAITSWYTDGVVITDMSRPTNIIKVGQYDTYSDEASLNPNSAWFEGCWGAYPYLPSGTLIASDINSGLYIIGATYKPAAYLEGTITSKVPFELGKAISGAKVEILQAQMAFETSKSDGTYGTGLANGGEYKVAVSHPDYISDTFNVTLINGEVTILDAQLASSYVIANVRDGAGLPVSNAKIVFRNIEAETTSTITTDNDGTAIGVIKAGTDYEVFAGKWGLKHMHREKYSAVEGENTIFFDAAQGYQDDFFADFGWEVSAFANSGNWQRGVPVGTDFNGQFSNPIQDYEEDLGNECFATGNNGVAAGDDDVDSGVTELTSPMMDMTNWKGAEISYHVWFFNAGGNTQPNDTMSIYLTNGTQRVLLDKVNTIKTPWSSKITHEISSSMLPFNEDMQIIVRVGDYFDGHIVEGGFDAFEAQDKLVNSIKEISSLDVEITTYPNPVQQEFIIELDKSVKGKVEITNVLGQRFHSYELDGNTKTLNIGDLKPGTYLVTILSDSKQKTISIIKE